MQFALHQTHTRYKGARLDFHLILLLGYKRGAYNSVSVVVLEEIHDDVARAQIARSAALCVYGVPFSIIRPSNTTTLQQKTYRVVCWRAEIARAIKRTAAQESARESKRSYVYIEVLCCARGLMRSVWLY